MFLFNDVKFGTFEKVLNNAVYFSMSKGHFGSQILMQMVHWGRVLGGRKGRGCHLRSKIIPLNETCKIMKMIPLVKPPGQNRLAIITTHSALPPALPLD